MLLEWCRAMTRHYEVGKGQGRWVGQEIRGREPFLEQQH